MSPRAYVVARCVFCKHEKRVYAGDVDPGDLPMCPQCYSPMVAQRAGIEDEPSTNGIEATP